MFKKQKEKLRANIDAKKAEIKENVFGVYSAPQNLHPAESEKPYREYKDGNFNVFKFEAIGLSQPGLESICTVNPEYKCAKVDGTRRNVYKYIKPNRPNVTFDEYKVLINDVIVGCVPTNAIAEFDRIRDEQKIITVGASIHSGDYMLINETSKHPVYNNLGCTVFVRFV